MLSNSGVFPPTGCAASCLKCRLVLVGVFVRVCARASVRVWARGRVTSDHDSLVLDSLPPPLVVEDGLDLVDVLRGKTNTGGGRACHFTAVIES